MDFWNRLIGNKKYSHKYKKGDFVQIKIPHSEGDEVSINECLPNGYYKVYIPYWGYFSIHEKDIIQKRWGLDDVDASN